jgi:hypothetical protein
MYMRYLFVAAIIGVLANAGYAAPLVINKSHALVMPAGRHGINAAIGGPPRKPGASVGGAASPVRPHH